MKRFKKLSVAIVALAMCALLGISVWAANTSDVGYTATLDNEKLCVSDAVQEATMTVKVSSKVDMDSFTAQIIVPTGLTIKTVTFGELTNAIYDETENMIMWWSESGDNVSNDILAAVTVEVPANAKGTYEIGFEIVDISADGGVVWETGATVSATLTVKEHDYRFKDYTVTDETHTANYVCANDPTHTKTEGPTEHTFDQEDGTKCVCGADKPVTNILVTPIGNTLATAYTVEGNVVTVTFNLACKVGYLNDGKYEVITAVANLDGSYSFTAPEGVTEVLLVVKGDITGDGRFNAFDRANIGKALIDNPREPYTDAVKMFAADVRNYGAVNAFDRAAIGKALLTNDPTPLTW